MRFVPEIEPLAAKALDEAEKAAAVEPDEGNGDAPLEPVSGAAAGHERRTQRNARIAALPAADSDRALALVQERFRLWEECERHYSADDSSSGPSGAGARKGAGLALLCLSAWCGRLARRLLPPRRRLSGAQAQAMGCPLTV